jgi:hypothetical protein
VFSRNAGGIGLASVGTPCPSDVPLTTGRALGLGGIPRLRAGFRGPLALLPLEPGIGGRSNGTGLAMMWLLWLSTRDKRREEEEEG